MGGQRRRLDASSWREVLLRFAEAGMTVSEFCAREGLNKSSFYRWRERFALCSKAAVQAPRRSERAELAALPAAAGFIDLGHLAGPTRDAGGALELRLDLGGGVVLQIVRR
jgi:hypothetical protein